MRRSIFVLVFLVIVIVAFLGLRFQVGNISNQFTTEFDSELRNIVSEDLPGEFELIVPVPILSITGDGDEVIITYYAVGGLIGGDNVIDLSDWNNSFESIEVEGFFLPGTYEVEVSLSDSDGVLRIKFMILLHR